jgi:hypothetical protein
MKEDHKSGTEIESSSYQSTHARKLCGEKNEHRHKRTIPAKRSHAYEGRRGGRERGSKRAREKEGERDIFDIWDMTNRHVIYCGGHRPIHINTHNTHKHNYMNINILVHEYISTRVANQRWGRLSLHP